MVIRKYICQQLDGLEQQQLQPIDGYAVLIAEAFL